MLNEPAWGLISARLGKKRNLGELKDQLWWADDGNTLRKYYDQSPPDWETARQNFFTTWEAVEKERETIAKVQKMIRQYIQAAESKRAVLGELERLQGDIDKQRCLHSEQQVALESLEKTYSLHQQNAHMLQSSLSGLKRLLPGYFKKNSVVWEWKQAKQQCDETLIAMTRQRTALQTQAEKLEAVT